MTACSTGLGSLLVPSRIVYKELIQSLFLIFSIFRDEKFSVMKVTKSDVIHANARHLPCIFKVSTGVTMQQLGSELLLLMETQAEMEKWVTMLEELSKVVKSKQQSVSILYTVN